jgi:hypothetical protein
MSNEKSAKIMFLEQSENFILYLLKEIPNDNNIKIFNEKFWIAKKANSGKIINAFVKFVLPHKEKIFNKNDEYFLNGGGQESLKEEKYKDFYQYSVNLKNSWNTLNEEQKDIIWKYFKILIILSEKHVKYLIENEC